MRGVVNYIDLFPEDAKPPCLATGVGIFYFPGEEDALRHLLTFFRRHFKLTERKLLRAPEKAAPHLPIAWNRHAGLPIKRMIRDADEMVEGTIEEWVGIGFYDRHQKAFRAYLAHLENDDDPDLEEAKKFFRAVEMGAFGKKELLH